jgi:hypothetical protein
MTPPPRLRLTSTADLLAAIPYLLGFHPADCVVVVALRGRDVQFVMRGDLPLVDSRLITDRLIENGAEHAFVVGYGAAAHAAAVTLAAAVRLAGVRVLDEVRVAGGRFRSPAGEGRSDDLDTRVVAAAATFHGLPALPGRETLVAQLAPVTGDERAAMAAATVRAEARLAAWEQRGLSAARLAKAVRRAGFAAVRAAKASGESGRRLADDEVAWLGLLLVDDEVCGYAWESAEPCAADQAAWTDVVRRVDPEYVPAPATLLGFLTWRLGLGATAAIAVDRALAADPHHRPAQLLAHILSHGLDPAIASAASPGRGTEAA